MSTILTLILAGLGVAVFVIINPNSCRRALISLLDGSGHTPGSAQQSESGGSSPTHLNELQERVRGLQEAIEQIMYVAENERIGSILWHAGPESSLLDHMLPCDGRTLLCNRYPILFRKVGTMWGGNGIDTFRIPDLRGQFARGWSQPGCPSKDPDREGRTDFRGGMADVGPCTFQQHQVQTHRHEASAVEADLSHSHDYDNCEPNFYYHPTGNARSAHDANNNLKLEGHSLWENGGCYLRATRTAGLRHSHAVAVEEEGGAETRPTNVSFVFAIIADLQQP